MLKDVSSKDADWIRDLRIILIAAQKNYVLDALLGTIPKKMQCCLLSIFIAKEMAITFCVFGTPFLSLDRA